MTEHMSLPVKHRSLTIVSIYNNSVKLCPYVKITAIGHYHRQLTIIHLLRHGGNGNGRYQ